MLAKKSSWVCFQGRLIMKMPDLAWQTGSVSTSCFILSLPQVQTVVSASTSDPHAGSRKLDPGQHDGKLYQHLPGGGNTRAVEGTVRAVIKMLRSCSQVASVQTIPNNLYHTGRASLSQLSEPLSWSEWSCPSTTLQRSTWSCLVTWGTPCTHTSCKFAESRVHAVPAAILFITRKYDLDLNAELMTLCNVGSSTAVTRKNNLFIGCLVFSDALRSSFVCGLAGALTSNPVDVVRTRMMNQRGAALYQGTLDCLLQVSEHNSVRLAFKCFKTDRDCDQWLGDLGQI